MTFEPKELELIERIIYKNGDDIAISIGRSFERLEERIDAAESRTYSRLADIEDRIDDARQCVTDILDAMRGDLRALEKVDA